MHITRPVPLIIIPNLEITLWCIQAIGAQCLRGSSVDAHTQNILLISNHVAKSLTDCDRTDFREDGVSTGTLGRS